MNTTEQKIYKFPSIEQFRHAARAVADRTQFVGLDSSGEVIFDKTKKLPTLQYRGTIKTHGTNFGIQILKNSIVTQSRERLITPEDDNAGAARWAYDIGFNVWNDVRNTIAPGKNIVIYGEWVGKGVQGGVALSQVDKLFILFAAAIIDENIDSDNKKSWVDINGLDFTPFNDRRIYGVNQFPCLYIDINFESPGEMINAINTQVLQVENECPVGKFFGVSGVGEGLVWYPVDPNFNSYRYAFKTKGEKHSNSKVKTLANVDVEKVKTIEGFVLKYAHNERCLQGIQFLKENKHEISEKSTGIIIRWVHDDILKEEKDTLEQNKLSSKDFGGHLSKVVKRWFFEYLRKTCE